MEKNNEYKKILGFSPALRPSKLLGKVPVSTAPSVSYKTPLVAASLALLTLGIVPKAHSQEDEVPKVRTFKRSSAIITQTPSSLSIELDSTFADKALKYTEKDTTGKNPGQLLIQGKPTAVSKNDDGSWAIKGNGLVVNPVGKGKYSIEGNDNIIVAEKYMQGTPEISIKGDNNISSGEAEVSVKGNGNRVQAEGIKAEGDYNMLFGTEGDNIIVSKGNNTVSTAGGHDKTYMTGGGRYQVNKLQNENDIRPDMLYFTPTNKPEIMFNDDFSEEEVGKYESDSQTDQSTQPPGDAVVLPLSENKFPK